MLSPGDITIEATGTLVDDGTTASFDPATFAVAIIKSLLPVDLKIWNGQDAPDPVPEKDKYSVGAFTVANLNDTDGDGVIDRNQNNVPGEKDLMQLYIGGYKGLTGRVKLTVKGGNVKFWETKAKGTERTQQNGEVFFDIPAGGMDQTLWVEARDASATVRDIEIWEGWEETIADGTKVLHDGLDKVRATAVWATCTQFANQPAQPLWGDVRDEMRTFFTTQLGNFGKNFTTPAPGIHYCIGFEYTIQPPGISNEHNVLFDVTRQKEKKEWFIMDGQVNELLPPTGPVTFPVGDEANDDFSDDDESIKQPVNDHIYSCDGPGPLFRTVQQGPQGQPITQLIYRHNFLEYGRVSFNGTRPSGNTDTGSRCSYKQKWHSQIWLKAQGDIYVQKGGGVLNDVGLDHWALLPAPTP